MSNFFITHKKTFLGIIFLVLFGTSVSFATPPTYNTLDPDCLPTDPACSIAFNTSTIAENTNLYFTNARARDAALTLDANYNFMVSGSISSIDNAYSVFIGYGAGVNATNATNAIFFGQGAGANATDVSFSNFIGANTGVGATDASYSNFLGLQAGYLATNAEQSNFFGFNAGSGATNANNSSFIGVNAGSGATNANNSNFFGSGAGQGATNAPYSNFLGSSAGQNATNARNSNFFGQSAGQDATNASYSNFLGNSSGYGATNATNSNFFGSQAGATATNATNSNFIGQNAGYQATDAHGSNFFGQEAGFSALNANNSNFLGNSSGYGATNAYNSNFLGNSSGYGATNAYNSNFLGINAGRDATNAALSNFFGSTAGSGATSASHSNFFGNSAGQNATNANQSNFFGQESGRDATSASYSNLFGYRTGYTFSGNNIGSNNIIIGTNISLPDATANAINLGGVLFGTNTYSTTSGNPSITAVSSGRIGIAKVTPAYTLDVGNASVSGIVARFQNSSGTCDINPTSASLSCSSDRTLKKNIQPLDTTIQAKVLSLVPVSYNWNIDADTAPKQTGFIAQDVEALFPDLVATDKDTGLKSLNYVGLIPYTIKAVQEMDIQIQGILPEALDATAYGKIKEFLRGVAVEGKAAVDTLVARRVEADTVETKQLCIDSLCITKTQLQKILDESGSTAQTTPAPITDTEQVVPPAEDTGEISPADTTTQ